MSSTPTRYPLLWPVGWKRAQYRESARFNNYGKRLSVADGVMRVLLELERLGVTEADVVISTNLALRLDGLPRSDQGQPGDPGVCVYWQRGQKQMQCMAIDRYDKVADNLAAVAATLEAMRAIERHGGAAILDRAFTGFTALPPPIVAGMARPWWEVLQVPRDAARDTIQAAYRRLASDAHPDKETGSDVRMAEINRARDEGIAGCAP